MERLASYSTPELPHSLYELPVQAKTICSCMTGHNSNPSNGHGSLTLSIPEGANHSSFYHQPHLHHHHPLIQHDDGGLNTCTRTCYSQFAGQMIPQIQETSTCGCFSHISNTPPAHQSFSRSSTECPCCRQANSTSPNPTRYHHISRLHVGSGGMATNAPHYADAFAPPPLLHASWEPTSGREQTHLHSHDVRHVYGSSRPPHMEQRYQIRSYQDRQQHHRHYRHHHHHQHHHRSRDMLLPREQLRRFEQEFLNFSQGLHNLARPYRQYSGGSSAFPYSVAARSHLVTSEQLIREQLMRMPEPIPGPFFIDEGMEPGTLEYELAERGNGRASEPIGMTKRQLEKLPSYYVTKKTLEEFSESDRCVVCMCEYQVENHLRVLPCAHEFHSECIDKWLATNPTCPICRNAVEVT